MTNNRPVFIATIVVVVLALSAAIYAIWQLNSLKEDEPPVLLDSGFQPSEELSEEMKQAATVLISNNYKVVQLYYVQGLPTVDEPYGNIPEDGIYTVDSDEYKTLADIDKLVDSTFVEEEAQRIKENPSGKGPVYFDRDGALGIWFEFAQDKHYPINWENPTYAIEAISDTRCDITLKLLKNDVETEFSTTMVKENGKWLLRKMIYQ